ncbi:MAG: FAD-dependent oxidoreductase [Kiritimatiellae bacterium]|nr:FAD-dependent oxidoreductase [Kiritimatiellia bacterium]MDD5521379.1 FAD-dependent oxidoreductase [Kiritimatiellia bacterium]
MGHKKSISCKQTKTCRREFLLGLGIVSAGGAFAANSCGASKSMESVQNLKADVLVVGGGTAGTIAAIQAARLGAQTVLVEAGSQLGGTTTTAGVDYPGLFHAWGNQVIAGIGWELVTKTVELNSDRLPDFKKKNPSESHSKKQVRISGGLYAALAEEACLQAGVQLRYYEFPISVEQGTDNWKVRLAGKGIQVDVDVSQIIDCTGNASVVGMIGLPRMREDTIQPGTLIYSLDGYDMGHLDFKTLGDKYAEALKNGHLLQGDMLHGVRGFLASHAGNAMHVANADSSSSETHTKTNIHGRQSLLRVMRFLKGQPGFEKLRIARLQAETGVRETFRIVGETMITVDDYTRGRVFDDAIAHSFYPIDLHDADGVKPKPLAEGIVPTIPLGSLIPKGSRNLMVAGRCLSSDRLANSALRVQASCMAMGQAAGATAALAAKSGETPLNVSLSEIRKTLKEFGAIVPA